MANRFFLSAINQVIVRTDILPLFNLVATGNVAETDLNIRTAGSGLVPNEAIGVILEIRFGDTGFPGANAVGYIVKKGEVDSDQRKYFTPAGNGQNQGREATVGLDINGFIRYFILASGPNTASLSLYLGGWILPV